MRELTREYRASHGLTALCDGAASEDKGALPDEAVLFGEGASSSSSRDVAIAPFVPVGAKVSGRKVPASPIIDTKTKIKQLYKSTIRRG